MFEGGFVVGTFVAVVLLFVGAFLLGAHLERVQRRRELDRERARAAGWLESTGRSEAEHLADAGLVAVDGRENER